MDNNSPRPIPGIWPMIDKAMEVDSVRTLHLTVGRPPMVRMGDRGLHPLEDDGEPMTWKTIQLILSTVVEPEHWADIERVGEGEVTLARGGSGRPITLTIFRNSEAWSAVVHF